MIIDDPLKLLAKTAADDRGVLILVPDGRHVLPYENTQFVGPIVPTLRLRLHMFPDHVETGPFGKGDIETQGCVRRRSIDPVRPITLIQQTQLKKKMSLMVQQVAANRSAR